MCNLRPFKYAKLLELPVKDVFLRMVNVLYENLIIVSRESAKFSAFRRPCFHMQQSG